jgi:hypothetical protein
MIAYAMAVSPDWDKANLTELLSYHDFVMSKALEAVGGRRPAISTIIQADYETRGRWMMMMREEHVCTITDALKYHRSHSAYLWANVHAATIARSFEQQEFETPERRVRARRGEYEWRDQGKGKGKNDWKQWQGGNPFFDQAKGGKNNGKAQPGKGAGGGGAPAQAGKNTFQLETAHNGKTICTFYNKGKCSEGAKCWNAHVCNFPKCRKNHARKDQHPTQP